VIASSLSDANRAAQSVSSSRSRPWEHAGVILPPQQRRLPFVFLMASPAAGVDTGAVSREYVAAARVRDGELGPVC